MKLAVEQWPVHGERCGATPGAARWRTGGESRHPPYRARCGDETIKKRVCAKTEVTVTIPSRCEFPQRGDAR